MRGGLRQRANKKSTEEAILPIISKDNNIDKEWRRRRSRRQQSAIHICQSNKVTVVVSIIVFAIACTYYASKYSMKKLHAQNYSNSKFDFQCLNYPQLQGVLNDDYCDCPDGSDEPFTSACSHVLVGQKLFSCTAASTGEAIKLFPSRIRDGVVDCHDGSDEYIQHT